MNRILHGRDQRRGDHPFADDDDAVVHEPGGHRFIPAGAPHVTACMCEEPCLLLTYRPGAYGLDAVEE